MGRIMSWGREYLFLAFAFAICLLINSSEIKADSISDVEDYVIGSQVSGHVGSEKSEQYYKLELNKSGMISIEAQTNVDQIYYYLYEEDMYEVFEVKSEKPAEQNKISKDSYLQKGIYYFAVKQENMFESDYSFKINFTASGETISEGYANGNDSYEKASIISVKGGSYIAQISDNESGDYYAFSLDSSGKVTINFYSELVWVNFELYNENGKLIWSHNPYWNEYSSKMEAEYPFHLMKGKYYFYVKKDASYTGTYRLKTSFSSANESISESQAANNDSIKNAKKIDWNKNYKGQMAINEESDIYKFTVSSVSNIQLNVTGDITQLECLIKNANGTNIYYACPKAAQSGKLSFSEITDLIPTGNYYLYINKKENNVGNYAFTLTSHVFVSKLTVKNTIVSTVGKTVSISTKVSPSTATNKKLKFSVSDKSIAKVSSSGKVKMLKPGKVVVYVQSIDNPSVKTKTTIVIVSKAIKLKSVKNSSMLSRLVFTCKFGDVKGASGYQVMYSTSKKFSKKKYKTILSNIMGVVVNKKGTYYVKVRSYTKCNNKKYYGKWSNVKKVTI